LILLTADVQAKKIKLDYEPTGVIVRFEFDNMVIFTDTTSIFLENVFDSLHLARTRYLIKHRILNGDQDTITFSEFNYRTKWVRYVDTGDYSFAYHWLPDFWDVEEHVALLADKNRLKILYASGTRVHTLRTRKKRYGRGGVGISYKDITTKKKLFFKILKPARIL